MAITRVQIEDGCISCGQSEANCPEVFKVKDKGAMVIEGREQIPELQGDTEKVLVQW